jgi:hypothetical protein
MSKPAQLRILVTNVDKLLLLTEAQLKVWMYYARRYGADGKAWGKCSTIATAANLAPGTVRNARAWLVKKGWLIPKGNANCGLPMFQPAVPQLSSQNDTDTPNECHPQMTPSVIPELQGVSFGSDTEVPTLKKQPGKDSALPSGRVSKQVSKTVASLPSRLSVGSDSNSDSLEEGQATLPYCPEPFEGELEPGCVPPLVAALFAELAPVGSEEEIRQNLAWSQVCVDYLPNTNLVALLKYNRSHKKGGLVIRDGAQLHKVLGSGKLTNEWLTHSNTSCRTCRDAGLSYAEKRNPKPTVPLTPQEGAFIDGDEGATVSKSFDMDD